MILDFEFGKEAKTKVSQLFGDGFVLCEPITGRTHQIRVHLSHHGAPIIGDSLYENMNKHLSQPDEIQLFAWRYKMSYDNKIYVFKVNSDSWPSWLQDSSPELFQI